MRTPKQTAKGYLIDKKQRIEIAIYRNDPNMHINLYELEFGALLQTLTDEPSHFTDVIKEGTINVDFERVHEWEFVLGVAVAGSTIFLNKVIEKLAEQFVEWVTGQAKKLGTKNRSEAFDQIAAKSWLIKRISAIWQNCLSCLPRRKFVYNLL